MDNQKPKQQNKLIMKLINSGCIYTLLDIACKILPQYVSIRDENDNDDNKMDNEFGISSIESESYGIQSMLTYQSLIVQCIYICEQYLFEKSRKSKEYARYYPLLFQKNGKNWNIK